MAAPASAPKFEMIEQILSPHTLKAAIRVTRALKPVFTNRLGGDRKDWANMLCKEWEARREVEGGRWRQEKRNPHGDDKRESVRSSSIQPRLSNGASTSGLRASLALQKGQFAALKAHGFL